jgi:hypothetical protein
MLPHLATQVFSSLFYCCVKLNHPTFAAAFWWRRLADVKCSLSLLHRCSTSRCPFRNTSTPPGGSSRWMRHTCVRVCVCACVYVIAQPETPARHQGAAHDGCGTPVCVMCVRVCMCEMCVYMYVCVLVCICLRVHGSMHAWTCFCMQTGLEWLVYKQFEPLVERSCEPCRDGRQ